MIPKNELGVIVCFAEKCHERGYKIISIGSAFPDAVIQDSAGKQIRVEFEFTALNFKAHGHDPAGCDLIVCWRNNWQAAPVPVLALLDWQLYQVQTRPAVAAKELTPLTRHYYRPEHGSKFADTGWRLERIQRGRYLQARKGSHGSRSCIYAGVAHPTE